MPEHLLQKTPTLGKMPVVMNPLLILGQRLVAAVRPVVKDTNGACVDVMFQSVVMISLKKMFSFVIKSPVKVNKLFTTTKI